MALTKQDLHAISGLLENRLKSELQPMKDGIESLGTEVAQLKSGVDQVLGETAKIQPIKEDIQLLKEETAGFKTDVGILKIDMVTFKFDLSDTKEEVRCLKRKVENVVVPQMLLLGDGRSGREEWSVVEEERLDALEADVALLKEKMAKQEKQLQRLA
ncbi:MAG: hypothetical protein HFI67_03290 [Lachnospiraceae bacterium]|jgi:archaellum component FlaC|nr:hypothetical protein [Lachnospiraceae bacterium]